MVSTYKLFEQVLGDYKTPIQQAIAKSREDAKRETDAATGTFDNFMKKSHYKGEAVPAKGTMDPVNYIGAAGGGMAVQGVRQGLKTAVKSVPSDATYFGMRKELIGQ